MPHIYIAEVNHKIKGRHYRLISASNIETAEELAKEEYGGQHVTIKVEKPIEETKQKKSSWPFTRTRKK